MLRPTLLLILATLPLQAGAPRPGAPSEPDTLRPGSTALLLDRIRPYSLERDLQLTRGDTTRPFGRQREQLVVDTTDGTASLLHVITFDTPAALTIDSSWVEPATLAPRRMVSRNRFRTVVLEFGPRTVRSTTTPAGGAATVKDIPLPSSAFEWNMLPVALSALDLHAGDHFVLPVFSDRSGAVVWYTVAVNADSLQRPSGFQAPMWRLEASPDSGAPAANWWVSRRHHFLDQARLTEPGVTMLYTRAGL